MLITLIWSVYIIYIHVLKCDTVPINMYNYYTLIKILNMLKEKEMITNFIWSLHTGSMCQIITLKPHKYVQLKYSKINKGFLRVTWKKIFAN